MDDGDDLRSRHSSEDSLASSATEPINLEDSHYVELWAEMEADARNLEAESWSVAVDPNYVKSLTKEAVNRQDVIYELMQTEMHHVRTLKTLYHVYMHELRQLIEEDRLNRLFPGVKDLLSLHQDFLNCLKAHQNQSQKEGGPNSYQITKLGEILISQFSGRLGEQMMEFYSLFCSHYNEAISLYKEQLQNSKKLQSLIKKIGQLSLLRRLGIPECFLLVTQRITKYPVLVERIIQNTEADTDEYQALSQGLTLIRHTISLVNDRVREYEKAVRLREIALRLEPKSQGRMKDGQLFRREDLIQDNRSLLHEGTVTWKSSSKQKDISVLAVLLTDVLLLLQEKDQKLAFAAVDNKPPVISLQGLIVREVAHEDKAMFLISAFTSSLPEMYEIRTGSREERNTWTARIWKAVSDCCPDDELSHELTAKLQQCQDYLKEKDDLIIGSLADKQQMFADLYKNVTEQEYPHKGLLLRGDATDLQQGDALFKAAMVEVENLQNLLFSRITEKNLSDESGPLRQTQTFAAAGSDSNANTTQNGDVPERRRSSDGSLLYISHTTSDPQLQEVYSSAGLEQSADDNTLPVPNCNSVSSHFPEAELYDRVMLLAQKLYSLQAVIVQQDSQIELQRAFQLERQQTSRHYSFVLLDQEKQRNLEKQKEELANLHRMQAQQREEQQRWEKERERQRMQIEALEGQLQQREEECRKWEEKLDEEKAELERQKEDHQQSLERLRESIKSVEKEKERQTQEKERLEQLQEKIKKHLSLINPGYANYEDPTQYSALSSSQSFSGSMVNGGGTLPYKPYILYSTTTFSPMEIPPKVPPRKESILSPPAKTEPPIHLISTTNQVHKPAVVQQRIPTKLATVPKEKEKGFKTKSSHQRTHSAANIDVNQVVPIRVKGKGGGGGTLRAKMDASPQRIYHSDTFRTAESPQSVKSAQSFIRHKRSNSEASPPVPPPFPKDVLEKGKEKVIFL